MTAFFIASITVTEPDKFAQYSLNVGPTLKAFGGELMVRGKRNSTLTGTEPKHTAVGVIKFPDMPSLDNWYASAAYQALIPLRNEACDMTIVSYNEAV